MHCSSSRSFLTKSCLKRELLVSAPSGCHFNSPRCQRPHSHAPALGSAGDDDSAPQPAPAGSPAPPGRCHFPSMPTTGTAVSRRLHVWVGSVLFFSLCRRLVPSGRTHAAPSALQKQTCLLLQACPRDADERSPEERAPVLPAPHGAAPAEEHPKNTPQTPHKPHKHPANTPHSPVPAPHPPTTRLRVSGTTPAALGSPPRGCPRTPRARSRPAGRCPHTGPGRPLPASAGGRPRPSGPTRPGLPELSSSGGPPRSRAEPSRARPRTCPGCLSSSAASGCAGLRSAPHLRPPPPPRSDCPRRAPRHAPSPEATPPSLRPRPPLPARRARWVAPPPQTKARGACALRSPLSSSP